jgi:predicted ribosome quality control (RQC) complex YloA/Tae2 family protein
MIQYQLDLIKQIKNIKEISLSQGQIQKIYSTSYYIAVSVRVPGKTWYLYFGRGGGFEGIWLHSSPPPSELRRKDKFLEYLRKHLCSCSFMDLSIDHFDRIVRFDYQKFGQIQSLYWFWKGRKLYFMHYLQEKPEAPFKILLSWRGKAFIAESSEQNSFENFNELGRHQEFKSEMSHKEIPGINILLNEERNSAQSKKIKTKPGFLLRKYSNIQDDLKKANQWKKLQLMLDAQEPLEDLYELKVGDHRIKFQGDLNSFERRDIIYQKIKKLKRGELILRERLESVERLISGKIENEIKTSVLPVVKPVWGEEVITPTQKEEKNENYKVITSNWGLIGVGLNSQGNDQLRNKWANKNDHWIHLDNRKSAHVILKINNDGALTSEILQLSASILAHFSQFQSDWIPIIYTQVKNLKGIAGMPGMVTYKKEKHLHCPRQSLEEYIKE